MFLAKTRPDKTIFSTLTNLTIDFYWSKEFIKNIDAESAVFTLSCFPSNFFRSTLEPFHYWLLVTLKICISTTFCYLVPCFIFDILSSFLELKSAPAQTSPPFLKGFERLLLNVAIYKIVGKEIIRLWLLVLFILTYDHWEMECITRTKIVDFPLIYVFAMFPSILLVPVGSKYLSRMSKYADFVTETAKVGGCL